MKALGRKKRNPRQRQIGITALASLCPALIGLLMGTVFGEADGGDFGIGHWFGLAASLLVFVSIARSTQTALDKQLRKKLGRNAIPRFTSSWTMLLATLSAAVTVGYAQPMLPTETGAMLWNLFTWRFV